MAEASNETKIAVSNLDLHYGAFHALHGITMDMPRNQITAFIGPSGCGKSTFLRCLNRMNDAIEGCRVEGSIRLDGEELYSKEIDVNLLRKRVGMVFQKGRVRRARCPARTKRKSQGPQTRPCRTTARRRCSTEGTGPRAP